MGLKASFTLLVAVAFWMLPGSAHAEMPMPVAATPTLYGGACLAPETMVLGASTGYPQTGFDLYFGLTEQIDIGGHVSFTYGRRLTRNRQGLGLDVHIPLRFTLIKQGILAGGLRLAPYFMLGDGSPAIATGADVGFMFDIALPQLFKIIVGPDIRTGFASVGNRPRVQAYDGASWVNIGVEALIIDKFHVGAMFRGGAQWGRLGVDGVFNALFFFGAKL